MKQFCALFFCLFLSYSNAQVISGIVLDSLTHKPLDMASVTVVGNDYSSFTDSRGEFAIKVINNKDSLRISYIGYETKIVRLSEFMENKEYNPIYYLKSKSNKLEEIVISSKILRYGVDKTIKSPREKTQILGFQFGAENCTFVANPYKKKGKVKTVVLDIQKIPEFNKENSKWGIDYLATYSIKLYRFDSQKNKPGEEVYGKEIIVQPENKTYKLRINLNSLNIPFPENGFCVGVEIINTKYTNPKKVFAVIAPTFSFTVNREFHPVMGWIRYRNEDWKFKTPLSQDKNGEKYNMMIVDAVVQFEK